jgi:zinc protease
MEGRRLSIVSFRTPLAWLGLLLCLSTAALAAKAAPQAAPGDIFPFKTYETTLDNGLRVVTIPYDSPGIVAYYLVVRTGSRDEVEAGHSGFAHFFEHMMFRGTEKYSQDAYTALMKRMGANSNASTADDRTAYTLTGPSRELEKMMEVESDRFKNLKYDEEGFRTEALAVLGEYNKNVSSPFLPMFEKVRDLAFTQHTYKHTTIGFLADIKAMPDYYQYSLQFFNRFYRPENVTLLVVGDVKPEQVDALAKKYYGDWKKGYQPAAIQAEPPQTERKTAHIDWPTPIFPQVMMGWHIPAFSATSVDSAAIDLISEVLFGETSPLYNELVVEKQWADVLGSDIGPNRDPGLFLVIARAKSADLLPKVQQAIDQGIANLQQKPVDAARLERLKSHARYAFALSLDSTPAIADQAADAITLTGDVKSINQRFAAYQKVTPADLQRVARSIFKPQNQTVVTLSHPEAAAQPATGKQGGAR